MRKKKPSDFKPDELYPKEHHHFGKPRCTAWNPNQGRQCLAIAMQNGKCRVHGGKTPKGIELPQYKDGRYSRYTPKIPSKYPEYLSDPNYLSLADEMALVSSRIEELYSELDIGGSSDLWRQAKKQFANLRKAINNADVDAVNETLVSLQGILFEGSTISKTWSEIERMVEQRRKLADTERRRVEAAQASLRSDKAIQIYESLVLSNREVIRELENEINPEDIEIQEGLVSISNKAKNRILQKIAAQFRTYIDQSDIGKSGKTA